nr:unnamed protein product [Callosobruchus chinensis]
MDATGDSEVDISSQEKTEDQKQGSKSSICSWSSLNHISNEKPISAAAEHPLNGIFDSNDKGELTVDASIDALTSVSLVSAPLGSRNAVLLFRSSALADSNEYLIREKPAFKLHITYKVLQAETKLLSKLLDCHGICEVAPNSSDFNLLWTGSHPKPGIPAVNPMLQPTPSGLSTHTNESLKMKFSYCRKVHSAEGFHNIRTPGGSHRCPSNGSGVQIAALSLPQLTGEDARIVRMATAQFKRRGGFVRIFPAVDSWAKYSQYLDPQTGIPTSGASSSNYINNTTHNYNLLLFRYLFPQDNTCDKKHKSPPFQPEYPHMDQNKYNTAIQIEGRQDRYERMLRQGHKQFNITCKMTKEFHVIEMKKKILDMLKSGARISRSEARKTFSHYLMKILRRIAQSPEQKDYVEVVLKFLQKASNYLRTKYEVKTPSSKMSLKDKTAIVAKQLNDFLYLYNRETDLFVDKTERPSQIPTKLYNEFIDHARESDLEEVLIYQTSLTTPIQSSGFKGMMKCIPNTTTSAYTSRRWSTKVTKAKTLRV